MGYGLDPEGAGTGQAETGVGKGPPGKQNLQEPRHRQGVKGCGVLGTCEHLGVGGREVLAVEQNHLQSFV